MVKSLATGKTDYVTVRIRRADDCILHLQGKGISTNRDYGVAGNIKVKPAFSTWVNSLPKEFSSLAGSGKQYTPAQVAIRDSNLHFQVMGTTFDGAGSRDYGAVLEIPTSVFPDLAEFVDVNQNNGSDSDVDNDDCCHTDCCTD